MRIGRMLGVPIYLSPVTLVFALITASFVARIDRDRLPDLADGRIYLLAAITAVGFVISLVLHEMGHAVAALRYGLRVHAITVYGFAGMTEIEPEPQTPSREFVVAFSGPAVNGLLAGVLFAALIGIDSDGQAGVVIFDLAVTNLLLFILNSAPGLPLDGGRYVVAGVWGVTRDRLRGNRAGAYGGFVVGAAFAVWGLSMLGNGISGLWTIAIAVFVAGGAYQSLRRTQVRERLPGLVAGKIARRTLPIGADVPLAEALRRAEETGATALVVTDPDGKPIMIMNGAAVDALPEERRPWVPVSSVSRTIEPGMVLRAEVSGEELLAAVQGHPATEYLVEQAGRPVGVLAMVDLIARIDPAAASRMAADT